MMRRHGPFLIALVSALLALGGCGSGETWEPVEGRLFRADASAPTDTTRFFWVSSGCYDEYRLDVVETSESVVISAERRGEIVGDCEGGAEVVLESPLGDRSVLDGRSKAVLPPG